MKKERIPFRQFPGTDLLVVQRLWTQLQVVLNRPDVLRWRRFAGLHAGIREQNLLQHGYSITMLGSYVMDRLGPYISLFAPSLDRGFVLTALLVHDIGEAILKRDVPLSEKRPEDDVDEYRAFMGIISKMPKEHQAVYRWAFLLQFCLCGKEHRRLFDHEAQEILFQMQNRYGVEAKIFDLIEHYDYLMFMFECYEAGNDFLLYHVLTSTELAAWERFTLDIPGVKEEIMPLEWSQWLLDFVSNYEASGGDMTPPGKSV